MRNVYYILAILFLFVRCEKPENIDEVDSVVTLNDTLYANYYLDIQDLQYKLDINNDSESDIIIELENYRSSTGISEISAKIKSIDNSELSYTLELDTTWTYGVIWPYNDTAYSYNQFYQLKTFMAGESVNNETLFTNNQLIISQWEIDAAGTYPQSGKNRHNLLKDEFQYFIWRKDEEYSWIKIEVLDYSKIVVHSYCKPKDFNLINIEN